MDRRAILIIAFNLYNYILFLCHDHIHIVKEVVSFLGAQSLLMDMARNRIRAQAHQTRRKLLVVYIETGNLVIAFLTEMYS